MAKLGITLGDCAGIGPEITLKALHSLAAEISKNEFVIYGNRAILESTAQKLSLPLPKIVWHSSFPANLPSAGITGIDTPFPENALPAPGKVQAVCGEFAWRWICAAAKDALDGRIDGIVTAPLNKAALHAAGHNYPGHTELLADCCKMVTGEDATPCMAFWSPALIMSLATIHLPLSSVASELTIPHLTQILALTAQFARRMFPGKQPAVGVLALNPHGGEAGAFGDEERRIILPAIEAARNLCGDVFSEPLVPDTAFTWICSGKAPFNAYVAMYHDQGLIPFKALAFDSGVNVTLGLPLIRTSPDHGTAFDLAGKGIANPSSMIQAILCALRLVSGEKNV